MKLHYWLEAFQLGPPGFFNNNSNRTICHFEARVSTKPLTTKVNPDDWEWPGEDIGAEDLHLADGDDIPDAVHVLAHYHDNYFDWVKLFTSLEDAKAKYNELEQALWEEVRTCCYQPDGHGVVKMSRYHCTLVSLESGAFKNPDKGSTWMLLPHVHIES